MANGDLDVVIRQLAKQQNKGLLAAAKKQRDRYASLAAKAKDKPAKNRFRQLAKDTMEHATAAARRLQISADNAADSFARSMRQAAAEQAGQAQAEQAKAEKAAEKKAVKTAAETTAKKRVKAKKSKPAAG
jgi:bacterioferritin (cytochrome b1)